MMKLLFFCALMLDVFFVSNAQTTNKLLEKNPAKILELQRIDCNLYNNKDKGSGLDLRFNRFYLGESRNVEPLIYFHPSSENQPQFPVLMWQDNKVFSRENISKLPAVNTFDIIEILDRDRFLTNW